jgi:hypothetical protein
VFCAYVFLTSNSFFNPYNRYCSGNALAMLFFSSNRRTASWTGSQALIGCFWILCAWLVSALDGRDDSADHGVILVAHVGGFKPLYGIQNPPVSLDKRQSTCASNGSNYCFGDDVNFCASCGICCGSSASSGYCCGSDQLCCGSACCASGQTCTDGECFLPLFVTPPHNILRAECSDLCLLVRL